MSAPSLPRRFWADMAWPEFDAARVSGAAAAWVAVLPIAAIEQHGPHLPVAVDAAIAEGHLRLVHARLDALTDAPPATFLPLLAYGKSNEHLAFPGTLTLSAETLLSLLVEIGLSVARAGVRRLVIVNSHGGNVAPMDVAARELRVRAGMLCVAASWHRFGQPEAMFSPRELAHGIHAGEIETSLMLAHRPDLVRMERAEDFRSLAEDLSERHAHLRATQPVGFGWTAQDLNEAGAVGNAAAATREKGEASAAVAADGLVALLRDVAAFDLSALKPGPLGAGDRAAHAPFGD